MASWTRTPRLALPVILLFVLASIIGLTRLYIKDVQLVANIGYNANRRPNQVEPHVHLLIPGNRANSRICRTLSSSIINDYPPPTIINWGQNEGDDSMNGYDMTTGKNWGVLKYLRALPPEADKDLVIMVDAHDVVFQLPLGLVLQRYASVNKQAVSRLNQQHGPEEVVKHRLAQTIIMGAEKFCWPLDHRHPACWAVPESTIRPDAYGNATDQATATNRPRWLNSGTVMGPVDDLRALYEWAHVLWMAYDTWGGDQDYFSNIYGRQELSRQRLRGSREWVFGFGEHFNEDELVWPHMEIQHTDYHLGVDTASLVFQALNEALDDLSSVVHSNGTDVDVKDRQHGTADIYQTPFPFPEDLLHSQLPIGGRWEHAVGAGWRDMRLFSNFHSRSIPAILHYNGDKSRMDNWWHLQWWTSQGQELLHLRTSDPGFQIRTDANETLRWEDMCAEFEEQVFVNPIQPYK